MAIKLTSNYSKRLGLPGYSSHQFSVEIETELTDLEEIPRQAERIYQLLQSNVDEQIQQVGFVPPGDYGMNTGARELPPANGQAAHAHANGQAANGRPASGQAAHAPTNGRTPAAPSAGGRWNCSEKQQELLLRLVEENDLDKKEIEGLALARFGKGVRMLDKLEASGLISELLETVSGSRPAPSRGHRRPYAGARKGGRQ